jgi:hypothetical protein
MIQIITKFFRPTWHKAWINELHRYHSIGQLLLKIGLKKNCLHLFAILADESVCGRENSSSQGGGQERLVHLFVFYYKVPLQINYFRRRHFALVSI